MRVERRERRPCRFVFLPSLQWIDRRVSSHLLRRKRRQLETLSRCSLSLTHSLIFPDQVLNVVDEENDDISWLTQVYDIKCNISNVHGEDDNTYRIPSTSGVEGEREQRDPRVIEVSANKSKPVASFSIWEEGKEESEKKSRARLMLKKELIREMSVEVSSLFCYLPIQLHLEEWRVRHWNSAFSSFTPAEVNRPKNLHLCKADIPTLSFD